MKFSTKLFVITLLVTYNFSYAQDASTQIEKRKYTTKNVGSNQAPVIDGKLDDAVWDIVEWGNDFIEFQPDENTQIKFIHFLYKITCVILWI